MSKHQIIKFLISIADKITLEEFATFCIMSSDNYEKWNEDLYRFIKLVKEIK